MPQDLHDSTRRLRPSNNHLLLAMFPISFLCQVVCVALQALAEERDVYNRSTSKKIYLNFSVNCIAKLRHEVALDTSSPPPIRSPKSMSHRVLLGGAKAMTNHYTVGRSSMRNAPIGELTGTRFLLWKQTNNLWYMQ